MDDTKAEPELSVFRLFLEARGIACPEGALEKRCPKEPDLLFRHADGSVVAYELVELLGQAFAHTLRRLCTTNRMLKDHFEGLPHEKRNLFLRLYGDADLFFWFGQKTTQDQRRNVLPVAFCKLLALPDGANHEVLKNDPALLPTLISVTISRGLARPVFDSDSYVRTGYPEAPLIQKKFENVTKMVIRLHIRSNCWLIGKFTLRFLMRFGGNNCKSFSTPSKDRSPFAIYGF